MKTKSKILSILLVLAMVLSIIPATVFAAESTSTMINKVEDLKPGTYYMGGYLESYTYTDSKTKEQITKDYSNGPYHMCTGSESGGKLVTSQYGYKDKTLNQVGEWNAKAFELVAVEGKTNTYKIMVDGKYLYTTSSKTNSLALIALPDTDTEIEWVASNHKDGGIVLTSNGVDLGTAGATSNLVRAYAKYSDKDTGELKMNSSVKYGLVFFTIPACAHTETEKAYDIDQHWTVCKACKDIQGEKVNHNIVDGACECGFKISTVEEALAGETGTMFAVQGKVTLVDGKNIYVQDATGGICVYLSEYRNDISLGDTVIGYGAKKEYSGLPELDKATLKIEESGNGVAPAAKETTIDKLTSADICTYVTIKDLRVTKVNQTDDNKYNIVVEDAAGKSIQLFKPVIETDDEGKWKIEAGDHISVTVAVGIYGTTYQLRNTKSAEIAAQNHTFEGEYKKDAENHWKECTCGAKDEEAHDKKYSKSEDGTKHYYECEECGYKSEATAHVDADQDNKCDNCGAQLCTTSHTYGDWEQTKAPTCTDKGAKKHTCTVCGNEETEEIPAHKLTKVEKVEATTEKEGCKEHYKCECGKLFTDAEGKNETTADKLVIAKLTNTDKKDENTTTTGTYTKVTDGKLVSGTYVLVVTVGDKIYAPTVIDGNWVKYVTPTISGNNVTDAQGAVLTLTVDGTKVTIKDSNGKTIISAGNNKVSDAEGTWNWKYDEATGTFTFDDEGTNSEQIRYFCANMGGTNKGFRAYQLSTITGMGAANYAHQFTLYKLSSNNTGDTTVKPSKTELKPISKTPVAETGYKYGMYNKKLDKTLYITGEMSGHYLATTTDASKAANVYLETVEGGYKLYFKNADGKKQYIEIYSYEYESNGEKKTGVGVQIVDEATNIYTWNAELKVLVSNVNGEDYYLGTYYNASKDTTYETMSASKLSYISGDNASKIGDTQYPAYLYEEVNVSTGDDTNLMAIVAMMVVAMAGMAVVVINRKRETV